MEDAKRNIRSLALSAFVTQDPKDIHNCLKAMYEYQFRNEDPDTAVFIENATPKLMFVFLKKRRI